MHARKALIDASLDLADELSAALMDLLRSIMRSAGEVLSSKPGGKGVTDRNW